VWVAFWRFAELDEDVGLLLLGVVVVGLELGTGAPDKPAAALLRFLEDMVCIGCVGSRVVGVEGKLSMFTDVDKTGKGDAATNPREGVGGTARCDEPDEGTADVS